MVFVLDSEVQEEDGSPAEGGRATMNSRNPRRLGTELATGGCC